MAAILCLLVERDVIQGLTLAASKKHSLAVLFSLFILWILLGNDWTASVV
jgi:hypothetical protein